MEKASLCEDQKGNGQDENKNIKENGKENGEKDKNDEEENETHGNSTFIGVYINKSRAITHHNLHIVNKKIDNWDDSDNNGDYGGSFRDRMAKLENSWYKEVISNKSNDKKRSYQMLILIISVFFYCVY